MTTYEMADLAQNLFGNSMSAFTLFLSVVFAYVVSAYLVGAKLTRTQVSMMTFVFVIVALFIMWGMAAYVNAGVRLSQQAFPDSDIRFFATRRWLAPFTFGGGIVTLLVALKFMWDVRHPKISDRD